jgi:FKBP-type peptidyl-prolyl cis-trans isomerase
MKKSILSVCTLLLAGIVVAQTTTKPAAAKPKPPAPAPLALKTLSDSTSYAIGVSVASFYKEQGITNINTALLTSAIKDVLAGKKPKMDEMACNTVMNKAMSKAQEGKSRGNIDSGTVFLQRNKQRPEVKTTASGLQYEVEREGNGVSPGPTDSVTVHYKGTLLNGTEFDNSYTRGEPITFTLNRVIPGWTEGLQLMKVGSKYKFYIPHTLGYGAYENGPIPGGSMLTFEVELLDVKKTPAN